MTINTGKVFLNDVTPTQIVPARASRKFIILTNPGFTLYVGNSTVSIETGAGFQGNPNQMLLLGATEAVYGVTSDSAPNFPHIRFIESF